MMARKLWLFLCPVLILSAQSPRPAENHDESKVGAYTLPDPLLLANGRTVRDASTWKSQRRPEILHLFESEVYGRSAPKPGKLEFEVTSREAKALGGDATRKEVDIWLTPKQKMHLLIYLPNDRKRPYPVFLGLNFRGNQAVANDAGVAVSTGWMRNAPGVENNRATEASRGSEASRFQVKTVLRRGYAVATVYYGDIFPDRKDALAESIIPHFYRPGQTAPDPDQWNAIGAWAWGLSRVMDYFEKDRDIDSKHVAVWGHSRLGKTALWAGAEDQRFAMVISNNSGEGGAALARRNYGETVERINAVFPHWFCANFKKYNNDVAALPVDQHELLALIAPRPVYIASAEEDLEADPRGEFLSAVGAGPVYSLFHAAGLGTDRMPALHQPIMNTIGYHIRAGKHDVTEYDWEQFLTFADKHWKAR
ncbi:MAG: acetylxylan esterase [Bryobacterales bacterium]|nr:acetylxylan esterase [Bryobacterales bacterium]